MRRWPVLLVMLALCATATAAGAALLWPRPADDPNVKPVDEFSRPWTVDEWQSWLQQEADASQLRFKINQEIAVSSAGEAAIMLENALENQSSLQVTLSLEDGQTIYEGPALAPGQGLERVALEQPPEPGRWPAVAVIRALDPETGQVVGQAEVVVTLSVAQSAG